MIVCYSEAVVHFLLKERKDKKEVNYLCINMNSVTFPFILELSIRAKKKKEKVHFPQIENQPHQSYYINIKYYFF
jgi:hypothetical protein